MRMFPSNIGNFHRSVRNALKKQSGIGGMNGPRGITETDTRSPGMSDIPGAPPEALKLVGCGAFAALYESLLITSPSHRPGSVLVCSASPGEGATTVATGLALAAAGLTEGPVLLVDCGRSRQSGAEYLGDFGALDVRGFVETLDGRGLVSGGDGAPFSMADEAGGKMRDALLFRTFLPNLWRMGFSGENKLPAKRLEPPKFGEFLEMMGSSIPFTVIDGPPVNSCPDSVLLAPQVSRILFVVQAGVTRTPVALLALSRLGEGVRPKIEVVMNRRVYLIPKKIYDRL